MAATKDDQISMVSEFGNRTVPEMLIGCWHRKSIVFRDGKVDTATKVIWLQTASGVADIRIPGDRRDLSAKTLDECSPDDLRALAEQDCFAAVTLFDSATTPLPTAIWPPELDILRFQPAVMFPEDGWLEWRDNGLTMIEFAPSGAYEEDWRLREKPDFAFHLKRLDVDCVEEIFIAGNEAIRARGKAVSARSAHDGGANTLLDLGRDDPSHLRALVDCEFSYARRSQATGHYQIELSTLPWLEQSRLDVEWAMRDGDPSAVLQDSSGSRWRILSLWRR